VDTVDSTIHHRTRRPCQPHALPIRAKREVGKGIPEWAGGTIVVNDGRDLIGIDAENGQTIWRTDMPGAHGERGIAYHDGYVYHPHAGPLAVVDVETGEVVHTEPPVRGSYYWVVGAGADKVFAQTSGALVAFEPYSAR